MHCANLLDSKLHKETSGVGTPANMDVDDPVGPEQPTVITKKAQKQHLRFLSRTLATKIVKNLDPGMTNALIKYLQTGRKHFGQVAFASVAFDAGKVGQRSTMMGFVATPDNQGTWLTPQVP